MELSDNENLNAEKTALDQMLVSALKETLIAKKEVLLKDNVINNLTQQIHALLKDKEMLNTQLKSTLDELNKSESKSECSVTLD